jgi:hypothetical protein
MHPVSISTTGARRDSGKTGTAIKRLTNFIGGTCALMYEWPGFNAGACQIVRFLDVTYRYGEHLMTPPNAPDPRPERFENLSRTRAYTHGRPSRPNRGCGAFGRRLTDSTCNFLKYSRRQLWLPAHGDSARGSSVSAHILSLKGTVFVRR